MSQVGVYATTNENVRVRVEVDGSWRSEMLPDSEEYGALAELDEVHTVIVEHLHMIESRSTNLRTGYKTSVVVDMRWELTQVIGACGGYEDVAATIAREHRIFQLGKRENNDN